MNINIKQALNAYNGSSGFGVHSLNTSNKKIELTKSSEQKSSAQIKEQAKSFKDLIASIAADRVQNIKAAEQLTKIAIARPQDVDIQTVTHYTAKAEDSIKEITAVMSAAVSAYQRIVNMPL